MTEHVDAETQSQNTARDFALEQIRRWHDDNVTNVTECHKTPEAALRWFCAYREAVQMMDCNTAKEWAHILIDGIGPMNPEAELETFFDCLDDENELWDGWKEYLTEELEKFFGASATKKAAES